MINIRLLKAFPKSAQYIRLNVLFQWLGLLMNVILSASIAYLIASAIEQRPISWIVFVIMILSLCVRMICNDRAVQMSFASSSLVKEQMRERLFSKLSKIGPSYLKTFSTAQIVQLSSEGVDQLETYFGNYIPQFFFALLAPLTLFLITLWFDWKAALILFICVPLIPVSIVFVQKIAKKLLSKYWGQYTQLGDRFLENLQGLSTLKIYQADERKQEEMKEEAEQFRKITMRVLIMQLNSISIMDLVAYGGAAAGIISMLTSFQNGTVTLFGALFIVLISAEFFIPMRTLGSYFHIAMNGMAASDTMFQLLDLEEKEHPIHELAPFSFLKMENLSFAYEEKPILKDLSLSIKKGEKIAFVGESGSGKSTIAHLMMGILQPQKGSVRWNDSEICEIESSIYSPHISYLGHTSSLFLGTVETNLKMGKADASEQEMWNALKHAGIADLFQEKEGLQTPVKEGGSNFSGGQRQRLALARLLLKNSEVMILDESISNVDVESEDQIIQTIKDLDDKTIIMISHRLKNSMDADRIYVLKEGAIQEVGDHETLLKTKGNMLVYGTPSKIWNGTMEERKMKRSNFQILSSLIGFVGDMKWIVIMAILMGVAGFMAAILIPVLGGYGILKILANESWQPILWTMVFGAFMRGVLRYAEQASNHYIAFKLLAHIRDVIFRKLRALAPAKLETKEKGNLISLITSDVELLEVFYAHTISPVCIAFLVSLICVLWQGSLHFSLALLALIAYGTIGGLLPYFLSKSTMSAGRSYREKSAMINAKMLEGVRGIQDLLQFGSANVYKEDLIDKTRGHAKEEKKIKQQMGLGLSMSNALILFFSVLMFLWSYWLYQNGFVSYEALLISPLLQISSFGPVIALSNLGTGLAPTLGAGNRLLDLLEEEAVVEEVKTGTKPSFDRLEVDGVDFGYGKDLVLQDFSLKIPQGKVLGIRGASGCGKSTLLKLLMRFWDVERGKILVDGKKIQTIQTSALRDHQSCVSQETHLFHDTIEKNISFVKEGASREEIEEACRKANIHDFILSLPQGYSTLVQELGSSLSGGEKQRIGLARAFLSGAKVLFLDEPTSNLDSLNEAIILKSIDDSKHGKTIILVSHRESTLQNCDLRLEMGKA